MEIYIKIFEVIFPVFFVIGIGYYLGKKNPNIDTSLISSLTVFDLNNNSETISGNTLYYSEFALVTFNLNL